MELSFYVPSCPSRIIPLSRKYELVPVSMDVYLYCFVFLPRQENFLFTTLFYILRYSHVEHILYPSRLLHYRYLHQCCKLFNSSKETFVL